MKTLCREYLENSYRDVFFSEYDDEVLIAKSICDECPIKTACLNMAIELNCEYGIFGGTTPDERKNMKRDTCHKKLD